MAVPAVSVEVFHVPMSNPPSSNVDMTAQGRSFLDTPGSTQTPETPKVSRERQWKAEIRKGPTYVARVKNINADREYIFVCRCSVCRSNGVRRATVSTFSKDLYQIYNPREERPTEGTSIAIDRHGFVSYNHPFPFTSLASRKRSYVRAHLRDTTCLDSSDPDFPVCARSIGGPVAKKSARTDSAVVQQPTVLQEKGLTEKIALAIDNISKLQGMLALETLDTSKAALQACIDMQFRELTNLR